MEELYNQQSPVELLSESVPDNLQLILRAASQEWMADCDSYYALRVGKQKYFLYEWRLTAPLLHFTAGTRVQILCHPSGKTLMGLLNIETDKPLPTIEADHNLALWAKKLQ